jgi:hypothetical protein
MSKEVQRMKRLRQAGTLTLGICFLFALIVSCTKIPQVNVLYRLPPKKTELKDLKVFLSFEDQRANKDFLGPGAKADYKNFSENFSFSIATDTDQGFRIGVFDLPSLIMETFKRKLEYEGITILKEVGGEDAEMVIVLKEFLLDKVKWNWVFKMSYEAKLEKDGRMLARQTFTGQAEQFKLVGTKEADKIVGEIYTGLVNQLDVKRLFQQGGLIK